MMMATWLLAGIESGLDFIPNLTGAGLMGNHGPVPTKQWIGNSIGENNALAFAFSGDIRMDSVIMHGCRPATGYYTVTKAAGQAIFEINGKPAIQFIGELLDFAITPEQYPFFLLFGVNHGERWGEYDEDFYASRLCLGIDKENGAIIMFEPDMVEGTEFRIMFRSMELDYIRPKIDKVFDDLGGREPVFAVYINCAGRCAGYGGNDIEDALVIQESVAGRVPVLGLYTGVEIASIGGRPRGLDWTGVFCLFSQSEDESGDAGVTKNAGPVWDSEETYSGTKDVPIEVMTRLCEQNAARYLALDISSIDIRYELEQKRRGFSLLSELTVSLRQNAGYESVFVPAAKRINATLNMQRTVVLVRDGKSRFTVEVLQGYTLDDREKLTGVQISVPAELLDPDNPVVVSGADTVDRFKELRELLLLPYFISSPIILQGEVYAILITGRLVEATPYLLRLSHSDLETVHAISALLASVISEQHLAASEERNRIMVDTIPVGCTVWDDRSNLTDCNKEMYSIFGLSDKNEFLAHFFDYSPEYQPDGRLSTETGKEFILSAFITGESSKKWQHRMPDGTLFNAEVTLFRVPKGENYIVVGYTRDLREQEAAQAKMNEARELAERHIKARNEFLASVSHEIRTPMNAIATMVRIAGEVRSVDENKQALINQGIYSMKLLTSAIETILDFSMLDSGKLSLTNDEFSVRDLIDGVSGIVRKDADKKSLTFSSSVEASVPELLIGDFARLQQVLFNIVINAIKFTETGTVDIRAYCENPDEDKPLLIFEVNDTGIGITDEQMMQLFKPLYAGDTTYARKHGGLGMGLPISHSLITLMGGSIDCESRPGEGSMFRIKIPMSVPKVETAETTPVKYDSDALRGMRVLVAEDNIINQMIMEELLKNVGIEVSLADNGLLAIEKLQKGSFDVILMDVMMPGMDGLTATKQIRADKQYEHLPILAMTANVEPEHVAESFAAGMNDHLTKPVNVEQLYKALCKWGKREKGGW